MSSATNARVHKKPGSESWSGLVRAVLSSAMTSDVADGATREQVMAEVRRSAGTVGRYAQLLELYVIASLDELEVLTSLPESDIAPRDDPHDDVSSIVPRRRAGPHRRR